MLKLFESAVIEEDLATSVQRYQLAVQEAKLRLDLAIAPGIWLMPSNLVINTESIVGYNNVDGVVLGNYRLNRLPPCWRK